MLFSHVKISTLLWLHNKSRLSKEKTVSVKWFGISLVFIFVLKIFHSFAALTREIFSTLADKFRISARPCNILYIFVIFYCAFVNLGYYIFLFKF